ncbi:MAG: CBS domain-containing protein [Oligoflexales bacterium]
MTEVGMICERRVVTVNPDVNITTAAKLMSDLHIGDLIVVDRGTKIPTGILTDRDIVRSVVAEGGSAESLRVDTVMTRDLLVVSETTDIRDVIKKMLQRSVRRVPVIDGTGLLIGIITLDDIYAVIAGEMNLLSQISREQMQKEQTPAYPSSLDQTSPYSDY